MHEGHRQRMYEKLTSGSGLYDHEILEMFLFNAFPRINTNPIAHDLLNDFGSLAGVFDADVDSLMTVKGVGRSVALYIKCNAEIMRRINPVNAGVAVLKTYDDFKKFATVRMRGRTEEILELYCIEKNGKVKRIFSFTNTDTSKVEVSTDKISEILAKEKPHGVLVAHNHLSGNSNPSANDDRFTSELQLMCSFNNVALYDHCIYASDTNVYSYFAAGRIDEIRKEFSYKGLVDERLKMRAEEREDKK
ncbi:MAG: hypothetical protein K2K38_05095 [Clostridia bacterium]|nr:hypothetical protein [Clostridia bacterium]